MGVVFRKQIETARQIRVEHVETARSELELTGLRVDDHLVAERHRAGQARIRDTRLTVNFESRETLDPLEDGGYAAASKRQHLERQPRARGSLRPFPRGLQR